MQKAIRSLKEVIGVRVTVQPEWPLLLAELGTFYPDKATLAPSVAAVVETFCAALSTLADDEENSEWADTLLEKTDSHIRISVGVRARVPCLSRTKLTYSRVGIQGSGNGHILV